MIWPKFKNRKIFSINYYNVIKNYYDHKREVVDQYFKDKNKHKKYFEDQLYGSSEVDNNNVQRNRSSKGKRHHIKFSKRLINKRKADEETNNIELKESDIEDFRKNIIKCKVDRELKEEDIHSVKNSDNSMVISEKSFKGNNININIGSNNIVRNDDPKKNIIFNDYQNIKSNMENLNAQLKRSSIDIVDFLNTYFDNKEELNINNNKNTAGEPKSSTIKFDQQKESTIINDLNQNTNILKNLNEDNIYPQIVFKDQQKRSSFLDNKKRSSEAENLAEILKRDLIELNFLNRKESHMNFQNINNYFKDKINNIKNFK